MFSVGILGLADVDVPESPCMVMILPHKGLLTLKVPFLL